MERNKDPVDRLKGIGPDGQRERIIDGLREIATQTVESFLGVTPGSSTSVEVSQEAPLSTETPTSTT